MSCPKCGSDKSIKNGRTYYGEQRYKCKSCGRQYIAGSEFQHIPQEKWDLVDKLLLEKLSLAGITRVTEISSGRLQNYVNRKLESVPQEVEVMPKKRGKLLVQMDEMWSFVFKKDLKAWIWVAIDASTREVIGLFIGNRSSESGQKLWDSLPSVYRQCATCYTDYWEAYSSVLPSKRHKAVGKESGKTNYVERLNNTLRQRVSRLVRRTLSFSKKWANHVGAIWLFIHHYNAQIRARYHYCG